MASNFSIKIGWNVDRVHLRLYGDFDGSSAHELLNLLRKICQSDNKILISDLENNYQNIGITH